MPDITPSPPSIVISYSHRDAQDLALRLEKSLIDRGYPVWLDPERREGRAGWTDAGQRTIDTHDVVLTLLSHEAYASPLCRAEHVRALRKGKRVLLVRVQIDVERPLYFERLPYHDFYDPGQYDRNLGGLIIAIQGQREAPHAAALPSGYIQTLVTAPPPPVFFVPRAEELERVRSAVLTEIAEAPVGVIAVGGIGGVGKTVLTQALCADEAARNAFPDGVIWIQMGPDPVNLAEKMRDVGRALGDRGTFEYETEESAAVRMRSLLADKAVLLVLDDVWNDRQLNPFLAQGPRTRTLFTSRNRGVGLTFAARPITLGVFTREQSIRMLRTFTHGDDPALNEIAARADDLPLALRIAGARLASGTPPADWVNEFDSLLAPIVSLSLEKCFAMTIDRLPDLDRRLYLALGVFPAATRVPVHIVTRLWRQIDSGVDSHVAHRILNDLALQSLLELQHADTAASAETVSLHGQLRRYTRLQLGDRLATTHAQLLASYNPDLRKWPHVSADAYLQTFLAYHLSDAGRTDALRSLLLDFEWLRTRLRDAGAASLLSDYEFLPKDRELRLVQSAIRLSASALATDPGQLPGQLLGRLSPEFGEGCAGLLRDAERESQAWLRPLAPTFNSPDGPLRQTLRGHAEGVATVAVSADNRFLVSGSDDGILKVWDLASGGERHTLSGHRSGIKAIQLAGTLAVSGSDDGALKRWNVETGEEQLPALRPSTSSVKSVALTPDGALAVAGYDDGLVRVWDLKDGSERAALNGHGGSVRGVAVTPDGARALSVSEDGALKVWSLAAGQEHELRTIKAHEAAVWGVALVGTTIAITAAWDGTLRLWNIDDGTQRSELRGHTNGVSCVAVTRDGLRAITGSGDDTLRVWDLQQGTEIEPPLIGHTSWVRSVVLAEAGRTAVSAGDDGTIRLWDLSYRGRRHQRRPGQADKVTALALVDDGRRAISASADGTLKLWHTASATEEKTLWTGHGRPTSIAVSADPGRIVTGLDDNTVQVWDVATGERTTTLVRHLAPVNTVALSADGRTAISGSSDRMVVVWDLESNESRHVLTGHADTIRAVACMPDGRAVISASSDGALVLWHPEGELRVMLTASGMGANCISILPGHAIAVSGHDDGTIRLWDLRESTANGERELLAERAHAKRVRAITAARSNTIVSASSDNTLIVWQVVLAPVARLVHVARFTGDAEFHSCAIAADGTIAAGDGSGATHFFTLRNAPQISLSGGPELIV